jgi:hypothetical protein
MVMIDQNDIAWQEPSLWIPLLADILRTNERLDRLAHMHKSARIMFEQGELLRREIVDFMGDYGACKVSTIAVAMGCTTESVRRHMGVLHKDGVVTKLAGNPPKWKLQ